MTKKNIITIYACGGLGINIGHLIEAQSKLKNEDGDLTCFAEVEVVYIDTSESNTKFKNIDKNVYLYEGIDGSGSDRTKNKDTISDSIRDILVKHPPGDLSIILNSTAGGSGSVIGPMLASQLLTEDKLVICLTAQTTSTIKQLRNTVSVLSSYESISLKRKKVLPVLLCDNTAEGENNVDSIFCNTVNMLAILFSGNVERTDSADLDHWINFNKVTSHPVGAVYLDIGYDSSSIGKENVVCSVATLTNSTSSNTTFNRLIEYQTIGFINSGNGDMFANKALHFSLIDGPIQAAYEERSKELNDAERLSSSRKARKSIASNNAGDDGISFD